VASELRKESARGESVREESAHYVGEYGRMAWDRMTHCADCDADVPFMPEIAPYAFVLCADCAAWDRDQIHGATVRNTDAPDIRQRFSHIVVWRTGPGSMWEGSHFGEVYLATVVWRRPSRYDSGEIISVDQDVEIGECCRAFLD
jgi:hypothetical protein